MSLIFSCGFDNTNWDNASIADLAKSQNGAIITSGGPFNTGRLQIGSSSQQYDVVFGIPKKTTLRWGNWHRRTFDNGGANKGNRWRLLDSGNLLSYFWLANAADTGHQSELAFVEYDGTANWTGVVASTNVDRWIEFEVAMSATVGTAKIWVNGVLQWSGTGLNTCGTYTAGPDEWQFYVSYDNPGWLDDLVIWDNSGPVMSGQNNGAVRIRPTLANGDGSTTDWTPLSAGTNTAEVDEAIADEDTSYNESTTTTDRDELDLAAPAGDGFLGCGVHVQASRVDAGTGTMKVGIKRSTSESTSNTSLSDSAGYKYCSHFTSVDPSTGAAWDTTGAAAAQVIYENAG